MYLFFWGGGGEGGGGRGVIYSIIYKQKIFFTISELYSEKDSYSNVVCIRYYILQYIIVSLPSCLCVRVCILMTTFIPVCAPRLFIKVNHCCKYWAPP